MNISKICNKCKIDKPIKDFGKGNDKDGKSYICIECDRKRTKEYRNNNKEKVRESSNNYKNKNRAKARYYWIKSRAKGRNTIFDISIEQFVEWYDNQEENCVYCGSIHKISVDRIIPELGYTNGNLAKACIKCNLIKSNILSFEEMMEIAEKYIKPKLNKNEGNS